MVGRQQNTSVWMFVGNTPRDGCLYRTLWRREAPRKSHCFPTRKLGMRGMRRGGGEEEREGEEGTARAILEKK